MPHPIYTYKYIESVSPKPYSLRVREKRRKQALQILDGDFSGIINSRGGWIYIANGHPSGFTKIGTAVEPSQRYVSEKDIKQYGFRVNIIASYFVPRVEFVEGALKAALLDKKIGPQGYEWFDLTPDDIKWIGEKLSSLQSKAGRPKKAQ